ncbi:LOW QUALITY PROTEIN: hypothetical protein CFOL_v3_34914 [Cephalotus follicularis]|uniref:Uncharacterized protein n=1 Tax=Cephalotus follicularis TaxID=3775 RepID=A0A1Q3DG95_CEPFO|nr:LOW QUALITY PROTEIN: hypothetical protein CFOL_v3_34914 [Cephalotus follicularis]
MGVSGIPLRISSREDCVNKHKGANDLGSQSNALAVLIIEHIGPTTIQTVAAIWKALARPTPQMAPALSHHVKHSTDQGDFACEEESKSHCWINVSSCIDTSSAVDKNKDHATNGPSNTKNPNTTT